MKSKLVILCAAIIACLTAASCSKHDPSYENASRPDVKVTSTVIFGFVTDYQGNPLAGATITVGGTTVTTDDKGYYKYEVKSAGVYDLTASYTGKQSQSASVRVGSMKNTQVFQVNFLLRGQKTVILEGNIENRVDTEVIDKNEPHGIVTIKAYLTIIEGTLPAGANLTLTPIYAEKRTEFRAGEIVNMMLMGSLIECTSPSITRLEPAAKMTYTIEKDLQPFIKLKKYVEDTNGSSGKWVEIPFTAYDDRIEFEVTDLTKFGIFADVEVSLKSEYSDISANFKQAVFDNLTGSAPIYVKEAYYSFTSGVFMDRLQGVDQTRALLLERLATDLGIRDAEVIDAVVPLDITLPVGTSLKLVANQYLTKYIYTLNKKSVEAITYGNVSISAIGYNRIHTGGGNYTEL